MIKLPSLQAIFERATIAFRSYPLTIISSIIGTVIAIYLIEYESELISLTLVNIMLCCALGISLFFCSAVVAKHRNFDLIKRGILSVVAIAILFLIYLSFPEDAEKANKAIPYIRFTIFSVSIHLLVSFIPYLSKGNFNGFWQYNKSLFLRLLEAVLYSGVLYVGLVLALVALKLLFDVDVPEKLYFQLFIFMGGVFNTWFFVAGVPSDFDQLDSIQDHPKSIKVFSQYILIPLLTLYFVILYSYGFKIVFSWNWPSGIVSYMIICVAVLGIFALLLLFPFQEAEGSKWVNKFTYGYYIALLPLVGVLFIAIGMRIGDYGLTINRYLILLLGIWLALICIYFIIGRKNIKLIPMSLAVFLLLALFGPWGMFSVSERSQTNRLVQILEQNELISNGKVINQTNWRINDKNRIEAVDQTHRNDNILTDSLHNEVKSIIDYLGDFHGYSAIESLYAHNLDSLIAIVRKNEEYVNRERIYMETLGLPYETRTTNNNGRGFISFSSEYYEVVDLRGYEFLLTFNAANNNYTNDQIYNVDGFEFHIKLDNKTLSLYNENQTVDLDVTPMINRLIKKHGQNGAYNLNDDELELIHESQGHKIKLRLNNLSLKNKNNNLTISSLNGQLLFKN